MSDDLRTKLTALFKGKPETAIVKAEVIQGPSDREITEGMIRGSLIDATNKLDDYRRQLQRTLNQMDDLPWKKRHQLTDQYNEVLLEYWERLQQNLNKYDELARRLGIDVMPGFFTLTKPKGLTPKHEHGFVFGIPECRWIEFDVEVGKISQQVLYPPTLEGFALMKIILEQRYYEYMDKSPCRWAFNRVPHTPCIPETYQQNLAGLERRRQEYLATHRFDPQPKLEPKQRQNLPANFRVEELNDL